MLRKVLGLAVAGSAMITAIPAGAATYLITYTGHVTSGYDEVGLFGVPNTDLAGSAYTAVYSLLDPVQGAIYFDDGITSYAIGGPQFNGSLSPVTAKITINGTSFIFNGTDSGATGQLDGFSKPLGYDAVSHSVSDYTGYSGNYISGFISQRVESYDHDIVNSSNFRSPLNYETQISDSIIGNFGVNHYDSVNGYKNYAFASLGIDRVTIATLSPPSDGAAGAVPEPATWAMMIVGLGAVGAKMRGKARRKARVGFA